MTFCYENKTLFLIFIAICPHSCSGHHSFEFAVLSGDWAKGSTWALVALVSSEPTWLEALLPQASEVGFGLISHNISIGP